MTEQRWTLRNIARRPIELHQSAEVIVLASEDSIEVDAVGDHHKALIARGLMTAHPLPTAALATASSAAAPNRAARHREHQTRTSRPKGEGA